MYPKEEDKQVIVLFRINKAIETFDQISELVRLKYFNLTVNRLYFAAYYAVSALLLANNIFANTHTGASLLFNRYFGKTGKVDAALTKHYGRLLNLRITGDYSDNYNLDETDVLPMIEPTKKLINAVSLMAKQQVGL